MGGRGPGRGSARRSQPCCQRPKEPRATGRFAAEVLCLQTATQFGDRTGAPRLRELESIGRGADGSAWRRGSPRPCATVTALNYPRYPRNSSGWAISLPPSMRPPTRRSRIAARTSADRRWDARHVQRPSRPNAAAVTPALRQATEPLPLTDREAEIVMLIGEGLSNRAVAERLTLSVRTVESHIYRAMLKTGNDQPRRTRRSATSS